MALDDITRASARMAVLGTAVVYGADVFCARFHRFASDSQECST
ncbi:hypothetical protein [Mycobacterium palustre]|nr:hypothetical protein [Mycobacterium palustre]